MIKLNVHNDVHSPYKINVILVHIFLYMYYVSTWSSDTVIWSIMPAFPATLISVQ